MGYRDQDQGWGRAYYRKLGLLQNSTIKKEESLGHQSSKLHKKTWAANNRERMSGREFVSRYKEKSRVELNKLLKKVRWIRYFIELEGY